VGFYFTLLSKRSSEKVYCETAVGILFPVSKLQSETSFTTTVAAWFSFPTQYRVIANKGNSLSMIQMFWSRKAVLHYKRKKRKSCGEGTV
jgi:hypothetical protein